MVTLLILIVRVEWKTLPSNSYHDTTMGQISCRFEEIFHQITIMLWDMSWLTPHTSHQTNIQQDPSFTSASISVIYDDYHYKSPVFLPAGENNMII